MSQDSPKYDVVAACAKSRAEVQVEYTVAIAIADAEYYRKFPETIVDGAKAKKVIDTLLSAIQRSSCFYKATVNGEEVFVLRSIDRAAPAAIVAWADAADEHGCRVEKVTQAYQMSGRWSNQPVSLTKWPD